MKVQKRFLAIRVEPTDNGNHKNGRSEKGSSGTRIRHIHAIRGNSELEEKLQRVYISFSMYGFQYSHFVLQNLVLRNLLLNRGANR